MGWTFLYNAPEKRQVIAEVTQSSNNINCLCKALHGNELWTIWYNSNTNEKLIILFLLARSGGNWGYKDMTEEMGPYFYQCPLAFLDEVPVTNEAWRAKVREFHAGKKQNRTLVRQIKSGQMVKLKDSKPNMFRVVSTNPLIGIAADGLRYKLVKTRIVEVTDGDPTVCACCQSV
jgi:hypothetical protein